MTGVRENPAGVRMWAVVMAGVLLTGCGPKASPRSLLPQPPATHPAIQLDDLANVTRARNLRQYASALTADARKLPGPNGDVHSRIVQSVFSDLLKVIPLLSDPESNRVLAQRLTSIQISRAQLATGSPDLAVEPAIETGLGAASKSLSDISHGEVFAGAEVGPLLDQLKGVLDRMERERDASLHRVDVAVAGDLISQVVGKLSAALAGLAPSTAPLTQ